MPFSPRRFVPCAAWRVKLDDGYLTAEFRLAAFLARTLDQLALAVTQLFRKALGNDIDRLIKIMTVVLGMEIGPAQGQMDFDDEGVLGRPRAVMPKSDVCPD